MIVREERTGWRDSALSLRHRKWGFDCPMTDIDLLVVEYDLGKTVAIMEYKNERYYESNINQTVYSTLRDLSDRANLYFFKVIYATNLSKYQVMPMNHLAETKRPKNDILSEKEYVTFLYQLRGRQLQKDISSYLMG